MRDYPEYEMEYKDEAPDLSEEELLQKGVSSSYPLRDCCEPIPGRVKSKCYVAPHNKGDK